MIALFVTALLVAQAQRPSAPSSIAIRDAGPSSTVSSGVDAYITWTVDPTTTGMRYEMSLDDGPWVQIPPADVEVIPLSPHEAAAMRMYAVNRGKLPLGRHTVRVRECLADGSACAAGAVTSVDAGRPAVCVMGAWGPWTEWSDWARSGQTEARSHVRYRAITTFPEEGAASCPSNAETAVETRLYVPPPLDPVSVTYVRMDSTTKGAWKGVYGSEGQVFAGATPPAPTQPPALAFLSFSPQRALVWTWASNTADERGMQKPGVADPADRFASTWYAEGTFDLDLRFSDARVHEVALYAVDWDDKARAQTIEVRDTRDTVLSSVTTGPELRTGVYYVWRISGHARIRVTRTAGANAVVFGLLFGQ